MLSGSASEGAAPDRGRPAGAKGARAGTVRGTRGRVRGACVAGVGHTSRASGAPGMAPPSPSGAVVTRAPLENLSRGGAERRHRRRRGAPASVQGGGVAGVGHTGRAVGGAGYASPPLRLLARAPRWRGHPGGGAERRRGRRRGAPASVQGPIKTGQDWPTGVGRGGRRLPAVSVLRPVPKSRVSPLPALYPPSP